MAATQEYSQIIREISQVVPLHARTTDFNRNKYEIPLEIVVPNDPEGQQVVAVARILCIGCQLRGICSTLPNPETLSFTETTNYIRSKAIMRERPDRTNTFHKKGYITRHDDETGRFVAYEAHFNDNGTTTVQENNVIGTSACIAPKLIRIP